jgi:hypothetical protein
LPGPWSLMSAFGDYTTQHFYFNISRPRPRMGADLKGLLALPTSNINFLRSHSLS